MQGNKYRNYLIEAPIILSRGHALYWHCLPENLCPKPHPEFLIIRQDFSTGAKEDEVNISRARNRPPHRQVNFYDLRRQKEFNNGGIARMNGFPAGKGLISGNNGRAETGGDPDNPPNTKDETHCHQAVISHTRQRRIAGLDMRVKGTGVHSAMSYQVVKCNT